MTEGNRGLLVYPSAFKVYAKENEIHMRYVTLAFTPLIITDYLFYL